MIGQVRGGTAIAVEPVETTGRTPGHADMVLIAVEGS